MNLNFGVQKQPIYGTYGEFTIESEDKKITAQYLLTKMKPGAENTWENTLADQMIPWREIFKIDELTFDELLQRDLDDSRVANDLIPYLLGESGSNARFFPPILAVLAPKRIEKSGILPYYPPLTNHTDTSISFGNLFEFEKHTLDGELTPLGVLKYNQKQSALIIVDGQHRAMAILALHRTINQKWGDNKYASYYNHLQVNQNQIKNLELPVCIVFFPDLHENNHTFKEKGIDLKSVCREIFVVVNKNAKRISPSRELLLDDEDLAARMMRNTLSQLKDRGEENASLARIYSFAFGDSLSDADTRKSEVVTGQLEYCTAVALFKIHCAISFGMKDAFNLIESGKDITHNRRTKNKERCQDLLKGTELAEKWNYFDRFSGKYHPLQQVQLAVNLLGNLTDVVILPLFDKFIPFAVYNQAMREVYNQLQSPLLKTEEIHIKSFNLLFEGSAVQAIFEDHVHRLTDKINKSQEEGKTISDYLTYQLKDAKNTLDAVKTWEEKIKYITACKLFNIDDTRFLSNNSEKEKKELIAKAKSILDAISTQAFQLGYPMTIHSIVELIIKDNPYTPYEERLRITKFIANLYLNALNKYFSSSSDTLHQKLTGFITESRVNIFTPSELGLRGLLNLHIKELNESQWVFFRYAILEIVHCKYSYQGLLDVLNQSENQDLAQKYIDNLPTIINSILQLRQEYIDKGINSVINSKEFKNQIELNKVKLETQNLSKEEIDNRINNFIKEKQTEIQLLARENIKASLGEFSNKNKLLERLNIINNNLKFTSGIAGDIQEFLT
ncbi:DNA sulfur modification protein DndB [Geminocystis herdmanii]|uniref:DNA sulfur modification protein DndB n=1 Tax=Geminocystis herdmanii TaxID=669359 RepID=UPI000346DBBF|nr:DNA sulfur modification protein DndB [Geminocystis herdmanii]